MTAPFTTLPLKPELLLTLDSLEFNTMTPIQEQSLPWILQGIDIISKAKTGSGKTAAFALGVLQKLDVDNYQTQALVICPTRELADQVAKEIRRLGRAIANIKVLTICGGAPIGPQRVSLERGAHIIVGTPGRLVDHIRKSTIKLGQIKQLILDEADRMLEMGFTEQLNTIIAACPGQKQTLLFSATYPEDIAAISRRCQKNPKIISVDQDEPNHAITQYFYELRSAKEKPQAVLKLLAEFKPTSSLVFCNTKQTCNELLEFLQQNKIYALALHGDLDQKQRDQVLVCFANRSVSVLIATDVAARGLDIKQLDAVINYEIAKEGSVHIHRIGRTGRAGETGIALNLVASTDIPALHRLEDLTKTRPRMQVLPNPKTPLNLEPEMVTLAIEGGKKSKLRAGDVLGALTKDGGILGEQIGKIDVFDFSVYVAVHKNIWKSALQQLQTKPIKGRTFKARRLM
ncbi:MAG TPA: ATP-dependent RNA helicase DbpA [Cellvibrionaceae bacterium]